MNQSVDQYGLNSTLVVFMLPAYSLFQNRTWRHLFLAQVIALFGTGFTTVALALLAYEMAGDQAGQVLGFALALKMVAYVVIAPLASAFTGQLPRRALLVTLDLIRAGIVLCLPFVETLWQVYLLIFLLNTCSAIFTPTYQATLPDVLPDEEEYTRALSLSRLAYDLENLLSPTLSALLLLVLSFNHLFVFNSVAFVLSALLVLSTGLPGYNVRSGHDSFWYKLSAGSRIYLKTPRLKALMGVNIAVAAVGAMQIVNTVVYVRSELSLSESMVPLAFAAAGVGAITATLSVPWLLKRYSERTLILAGGTALGLSLLLGLLQPGYYALLIIWAILGCCSALAQTPIGLVLKHSCHEEDRPALFAAQFSLSHACWLVMYLLAGWLGASLDLTIAFATLSIIALSAIAVAWRLWPAQEASAIWHSHPAQQHDHLHTHDDDHHHHHHEGWEGPEPHSHPHEHQAHKHRHAFVIDRHHLHWPM